MSDLQIGGCPNCGKSSCVAMACKSGDLHQAIINIKVPKILDALLAAAELALERDRRIAELEAALRKAREAMETCTPGDWSTGHVIHPSYDEKAIDSSCAAIDKLLKD